MTNTTTQSTQTTQIYNLHFLDEGNKIVFYVGRTNDPARRLAEHRTATRRREQTNKYLFTAELENFKMDWNMEVVCTNAVDDEDSEYEWVLKYARQNEANGIEFFDNYLCNMKAGDILNEMLGDKSITTAEDIKKYKVKKAEKAEAEKASKLKKQVTYENAKAAAARLVTQEPVKYVQKPMTYETTPSPVVNPPVERTRYLGPMDHQAINACHIILMQCFPKQYGQLMAKQLGKSMLQRLRACADLNATDLIDWNRNRVEDVIELLLANDVIEGDCLLVNTFHFQDK